MDNWLMRVSYKPLLQKHAIVESVFDQLKNTSQIEHSQHRNPVNFFINLLVGLVAYARQAKSHRYTWTGSLDLRLRRLGSIRR